jgi:hypothetical protein
MTLGAKILAAVEREPILIVQGLSALLSATAAFGLKLSPAETAGVMGLGQFAAVLVGRAMVTPNATSAANVHAALLTDPPAKPSAPKGLPMPDPAIDPEAVAAEQAAALVQNLPVQTDADVQAVVNDGETAVEKTADADIAAQAGKVPVIGPIAASILEKAVNSGLETVKTELEGFLAYHLTNSTAG